MTIREHCDSIRHKVDLAREIALEKIHKESNALMTEIDTHERECLSSWTEAKESTEITVEDVSKRMRAFLAEQQAFLQSVHASDDEVTLRLDEANKLAQELSDRKMELKAAMFNNKLASFITFPSMSIDDTSLGELAFSTIEIPFKALDMASNELTAIDIRVDYDFVLPLEHGQRIVAFKWYYFDSGLYDDNEKYYSQMTCVDRLGRLFCTNNLDKAFVRREDVAQCGPNQFVVTYDCDSPKLSVYNSSLHCLRTVDCKNFSNICCNSKFVFGIWNTHDSIDSDEDDHDNYNDERDEQEEYDRIQVRHLDTLSKAFQLRPSDEYWIERILADEHHVVAMSQLNSERGSPYWYMNIFNLATCNESDNNGARRGGDKTARTKFFLAEKTIDLDIESQSLPRVFLFDGWLVFPLMDEEELVWFDKEGKRSETSTELDSHNFKEIFSFDSGLIFSQHDSKILLKL